MSNSLWPQGPQNTRLPYSSPFPGACSNPCPLSWWYHPTISSSVTPFSSWLHYFPPTESFSSQWALHIRWSKYSSFSFSISSSNECSALIPFADWLVNQGGQTLPAVQGTLKSLLQRHSLKALVLWCSAFFMVQISHPYMTTGKTVALTKWTFFGKVRSLLFHTLYRFVIAFLPRSRCLLISWLQSLSAVILESQKIKSFTVSIVCPSICMK